MTSSIRDRSSSNQLPESLQTQELAANAASSASSSSSSSTSSDSSSAWKLLDSTMQKDLQRFAQIKKRVFGFAEANQREIRKARIEMKITIEDLQDLQSPTPELQKKLQQAQALGETRAMAQSPYCTLTQKEQTANFWADIYDHALNPDKDRINMEKLEAFTAQVMAGIFPEEFEKVKKLFV